ncbi:MAG: carbon-nitrogen hydrolase, partial [Chloroflexota bacterium]
MKVTLAALQMSCGPDREANLDKAERMIRSAAKEGANIILPQEMFATQFFANFDWSPDYFSWAETVKESGVLARMRRLAKELGVVIPANFFERAGQAYFNTNVIIDADGRDLGLYRKMHMPLGPPSCYEKYYTSPGDTGFSVFETAFGTIGCAVCWDQWFPETARIMALKGAEMLFYPTAIGSDCHDHWQAAMCGHAASNIMPIVTANRVGTEAGRLHTTTFWGRSFITNHKGALLAKAGSDEEVIVATVDLEENRKARADWGMFRDRR